MLSPSPLLTQSTSNQPLHRPTSPSPPPLKVVIVILLVLFALLPPPPSTPPSLPSFLLLGHFPRPRVISRNPPYINKLSLSRRCLPVRHAIEYNKGNMPPLLLLPAGGLRGCCSCCCSRCRRVLYATEMEMETEIGRRGHRTSTRRPSAEGARGSSAALSLSRTCAATDRNSLQVSPVAQDPSRDCRLPSMMLYRPGSSYLRGVAIFKNPVSGADFLLDLKVYSGVMSGKPYRSPYAFVCSANSWAGPSVAGRRGCFAAGW